MYKISASRTEKQIYLHFPKAQPNFKACAASIKGSANRVENKIIQLFFIPRCSSKGYEVNTELRPTQHFWHGEEYHQDYYNKTGEEPYCHIRTKKF